jgi:hypothetical protein
MSADAPASSIRVGVRLPCGPVPRWVASVLQQLSEFDFVTLGLLLVDRRARRTPARRRLNGFAYELYEALDRRIYRDAHDPFELVPVPDSESVPVLELERVDEAFRDAVRAHELDVIVFFEPDPASTSFAGCATEGVWFFEHGRPGEPPYFRELHEQALTFRTALLADRPDGRHLLYESHAEVDLVSLQRGRTGPYWKTAQFLARRLTDLHRGGWRRITELPGYATMPTTVLAPPRPPGLSTVALHIARMAWGVARRRAVRSLFREQWFVAYRPRVNGLGKIDTGPPFKVVRLARDHLLADPFVIERDGEAYIFCEDMTVAEGKGRISYMRLEPDGPGEPVSVLERPYHLSYPFVFEHRGETYMIPEASGARRVDLYRATRFPDEWELADTLLEDLAAVDATLLEHEGRLWLFANVGTAGSAAVDELFLYSADSLTGSWEAHPMNPIVSDVRRARPAGRVFRDGGALIRLGQDSSGTYGRRITLNRVEVLSRTSYREREVAAISPDWLPGNLASHTYTFSEQYEVLDGRIRRPKFAFLDWLARSRPERRRT